ncbi:acetyl-CoA hydrolase/transferase family protein [Desulfoluna spongiiphila]|uniref:Probable butyrate:acetyl-CoA coenzyme A-transferase n=1 Tax=Desulfoluna spongiiphila TaxID=419481 RepID=A0A1G5IL61_9BACT|nr:acetyl-CoA hydrolase/transferase C-terminal domain-containing protein [Desulfoluna spongiiphila]SCY76501.1 butyryl-CoA:acetate CoA-transferase [Desulfoluna spongiiphila]
MYRGEYRRKCVDAATAVKQIKSGDWVDYGHFLCSPVTLDDALANRAGELEGVNVRGVGYAGLPKVAVADPSGRSFNYNSFHFSGGERYLHDRGGCSYIPVLYHEANRVYDEGDMTADVFMAQAAPMDESGFFNLGIANSFQYSQIRNASTVILEVNKKMPVCYGGYGEAVHISEVDYVVQGANPGLVSLPRTESSDVDRAIARHVVDRIEDGSCLQLGIGSLPNAIGRMIADSELKDLGVHTEMLVDAYVDMYRAGRISNREKANNPGKMVYTFALGSEKLYEFIHRNPACASYPVGYVNDLHRIAANDRVVSINNAVEVDLYGQVCSESSGFRHISGTGGQFDFAYGSYHSRGGKAFICLASTKTDRTGTVTSRIRPFVDHGTIVTLPRAAVQYVVTEYGVASLKGKSTWQRAEALIGIAHPEFREGLMQEAEKMNIWRGKRRSGAGVALSLAG